VADLDVVVVGDCNPDLILTGQGVVPQFGQRERLVDDARLVIGGSASITACGLTTLGLRTAFVSRVGADPLGRFMLEALSLAGVDTSGCRVDEAGSTGISVILSKGSDRAILTAAGASTSLNGEEISDRLLARSSHLHISSYFIQSRLQAGVQRLVSRTKASSTSISLDPNFDPAEQWDSGLPALLNVIDILMPNEQEVMGIAGRITSQACSVEEAAIALSAFGPLVVVKLGQRGAMAASSGEVTTCDAFQVPEVADTTGAGDSFNAGFLAGWLAGSPLEQCLAIGCACGAASTRALGGTAAQPRMEEVAKIISAGGDALDKP
jgi:sugar/nucleoside kinase (ribokinase family)